MLWGRHADAPRPDMRGERLSLPDGAEIRIRPIEPADAAELGAAFSRLTAVTRYGRFLGDLDHITPRQLDYLTTVDHVDHEALAAFEAETGMGIGVARYVRDAHDPSLAEVAVVVADAWQGRRVGTALLGRLSDRAYAAGVERLVGRLIVGNKAACALAAHLGTPMRESRGAGTLELTVRLDPRWSDGTPIAPIAP